MDGRQLPRMDGTTNDSTTQSSKHVAKKRRRVYWRGDFHATPLATTLSRLMIARGLTPTTLSERSGVSRQSIYKILTSRRHSPTIGTVEQIAEALEVTAGELIDGTCNLE